MMILTRAELSLVLRILQRRVNIMEKEISVKLKLYVNVCHNKDCEMEFSIIAHGDSGAWMNQMYNYCPYCGAKGLTIET